jgi:DNA-binding response OmpR family regulator
MMLESLLLSRDPEVISILRPALEALSIEVEICHEPDLGMRAISSARFDAVIVDCDDIEGGLDILEATRKQKSNRSSVAFAVLNGATTTQEAFDRGANFVLQKPISPLNARRCFTAALGTMQRERRRYFRLPIDLAVSLTLEGGGKLEARTTNISEGGMAISLSAALPDGRIESVSFCLPEKQLAIATAVELAWADGAAQAGLRFVDMPQAAKDEFCRWLFEKTANLVQA